MVIDATLVNYCQQSMPTESTLTRKAYHYLREEIILGRIEAGARLTEETTWVDRLRVAAESHDRAAFERLRREHSERFPDGQL